MKHSLIKPELEQNIYKTAEKSPQQQFEGNMTNECSQKSKP
jgi:hypothetical protein